MVATRCQVVVFSAGCRGRAIRPLPVGARDRRAGGPALSPLRGDQAQRRRDLRVDRRGEFVAWLFRNRIDCA